MAIKITNFNPVWKYVQKSGPIGQSITKYFDGAYIFVTFQVFDGKTAGIQFQVWDKKPETVENVYNGAKVIEGIQYGPIPVNIQGDIVTQASEAVVAYLSELNPGVTFEIVDLKA